MEKAAIYHRPESEMAYLTGKNQFTIRLRTKHQDVTQAELIYGDFDRIRAQKKNSEIENQDLIRPNVDAMKCIFKTELYDYWEVTIPVKVRHRTQYVFHLIGDHDGELLYDAVNVRVYMADFMDKATPFCTPYYQDMFITEANPEWAKHIVWYQIMIDRFADGDENNDPLEKARWDLDKSTADNFYGGDLQGIIDKLDYLTELGINGIKLSPIFASYTNFKDDPVDFYDISYMFGSKDKFRELVQKAHEHGIRVMVQMPLDRMSDMSLQWQDVQKMGAQSRFANWFKVREFPVQVPTENDDPERYYLNVNGNVHWPKLNLQNPTVQQYLSETARYWVETFDIDGWEVLNADEIDQTFLNLFTKQLHGIKADFLVLGQYQQVPTGDLARNYIDGANNAAFYQIAQSFFINHEINVTDMISRINDELMKHTTRTNQALIYELENFTTPRLLTQCIEDQDLACAMMAFMCLQIGTPSFMYGTEVGVMGDAAPENCAPMIWKKENQSEKMQIFMKQLIEMRRTYAELLNEGSFEWGQSSNKYRYFALTREYDGTKLFSLFNFGYGSIKVVIPPKAEVVLQQNLMDDDSKLGENGLVIFRM